MLKTSLVAGAVILLNVLLLPSEGRAEMTAQNLKEACEKGFQGQQQWEFLCLGYIMASLDMGKSIGEVCPPKGVTSRQVRDVTVKWLRARPEARHEVAIGFAMSGMSYAFPCK